MISHGQLNSALNTAFNMAQQTTGLPVAHPTPYGVDSRSRIDIKDPEPDHTPSDSQPPGVDDDMPQSLEEALLGE